MKTNVTTLQANSGKVLDTSTNQMVQVYGDVVGYLTFDNFIHFNNSAGSSSASIFYYAGYFYRLETEYKSNSSTTVRMYRGNASSSSTVTINSYMTQLADAYAGSSQPRQGVSTVHAKDNILVCFNTEDNYNYSLLYDITKNVFTVCPGPTNANDNSYGALNTPYEYGVTTNYIFYIQRYSTMFYICFKSRVGGNTFTQISFSASVGYSYVCGVFGDKIYVVIAANTTSSAVGYIVDLANNGSASTGWFNPNSTNPYTLMPLFFDDRYIYGLIKNMTNEYYGNKIFIYDTQSNSSNLASITTSLNATFGVTAPNANFHYIGHVSSNIAYVLMLFTNDNQKAVAMQINSQTGTYLFKELSYTNDTAIFFQGIPKTGSYKRTLNDAYFAGGTEIVYNGIVLNWDKARISLVTGIDPNDTQKIYMSKYINFSVFYPKVKCGAWHNSNSIMSWNGIIRSYGTVLTNSYYSLDTSAVKPSKIIGKKVAKFYTNFT